MTELWLELLPECREYPDQGTHSHCPPEGQRSAFPSQKSFIDFQHRAERHPRCTRERWQKWYLRLARFSRLTRCLSAVHLGVQRFPQFYAQSKWAGDIEHPLQPLCLPLSFDIWHFGWLEGANRSRPRRCPEYRMGSSPNPVTISSFVRVQDEFRIDSIDMNFQNINESTQMLLRDLEAQAFLRSYRLRDNCFGVTICDNCQRSRVTIYWKFFSAKRRISFRFG
jgi:hypothetical protein